MKVYIQEKEKGSKRIGHWREEELLLSTLQVSSVEELFENLDGYCAEGMECEAFRINRDQKL